MTHLAEGCMHTILTRSFTQSLTRALTRTCSIPHSKPKPGRIESDPIALAAVLIICLCPCYHPTQLSPPDLPLPVATPHSSLPLKGVVGEESSGVQLITSDRMGVCCHAHMPTPALPMSLALAWLGDRGTVLPCPCPQPLPIALPPAPRANAEPLHQRRRPGQDHLYKQGGGDGVQ